MAGIPHRNDEQQRRKQIILDYMCEHLGEAFSADDLAEATGMVCEDAQIAVEALAYEQEVAKEHTEGGQKIYRRRP